MRPAYLHHVTLNTAHVARTTKVGDDVLALVGELLDRCLDSGAQPVPAVEAGYTISAAAFGGRRCLLASVAYDDEPVVTIGVAGHSRCGAPLWRSLHEDVHPALPPLATQHHPCPPEPWCAVRLEPAAGALLPAMEWLADFERCVAWAWLLRSPMTEAQP